MKPKIKSNLKILLCNNPLTKVSLDVLLYTYYKVRMKTMSKTESY